MSYLWLFDEFLAAMGMVGVYRVRIDHCMRGAAYQQPQLWLASNPELAYEAEVCKHPRNARPENISGGSKARRTAPYPTDLCRKIAGSFMRLHRGGPVYAARETRAIASWLLHHLFDPTSGRESPFYDTLRETGRAMLAKVRSG